MSRFGERIFAAARRRAYPAPPGIRHAEYSMCFSAEDDVSEPSDRLLDISFAAAENARNIDLSSIAGRLDGRFPYPDELVNQWPGEHYRLLAGLVAVLSPRVVVEIGTAEGMSALSLLHTMPPGGRVVTFDLVPWVDYPRTCLVPSDFAENTLEQVIADLGEASVFETFIPLLRQADLVFIDAAKDGMLESRLVQSFESLKFVGNPVFVFDDIRLWNMLGIWRSLTWPKLDVTSWGHWTGTGLCELPHDRAVGLPLRPPGTTHPGSR